ncbi:exopolyphosphatase [Oceanimonas sp. MB9]|uniref:Ppx/GppA phosphatase family protein n=1 Tax=Oceanimonas sp. MB9 TaxID=2588453 RepID=UPI0013F60818|nr:exopolyphosphatase [Oceanimonas sp. MB9]NHI01346.1 Exopolyphosphatase [Oceanimonas sp. MB9]
MTDQYVATMDLGSNSFHMVIARYHGDGLRIVDRLKQRVRLADGLDDGNRLSEDAMARGLDCLRLFGERLNGFHATRVRVAGTYTLREAVNAQEFVRRGQQVLGFPIDIVSGNEEARLIYHGVAHTQQTQGQVLVIDIGGGSTELVIGQDFDCRQVSSRSMGCVSFTRKYFADGVLSEARFQQAIEAAEYQLVPILGRYLALGWDQVLGSSGTIKTLLEMCTAATGEPVINLTGLKHIKQRLVQAGHIDQVDMAGLSEDRKPLIAAGLSILLGIYHSFNLDRMGFSDGALREGLLYSVFGRAKHHDIQLNTLQALAGEYDIDRQQADRVQDTARQLFVQVCDNWRLNANSGDLLGHAARLHEIGLHINFTGVHRHSAYIVGNTDLPGFTQEQQKALAALVRFHRKALKLSELEPLNYLPEQQLWRLVRLLRIAVALNRRRQDGVLPPLVLKPAAEDELRLHLPADWCAHNALLLTTLEREQAYQDKAGWKLTLVRA